MTRNWHISSSDRPENHFAAVSIFNSISTFVVITTCITPSLPTTSPCYDLLRPRPSRHASQPETTSRISPDCRTVPGHVGRVTRVVISRILAATRCGGVNRGHGAVLLSSGQSKVIECVTPEIYVIALYSSHPPRHRRGSHLRLHERAERHQHPELYA